MVGSRGAIDMGIPLSASVADAMRIRRRRRYRFAMYCRIEEQIDLVSGRQGEDIHLWQRSVDKYSSEFSSPHMWNLIRTQRDRVGWSSLVWFSQATPKFAFIVWLAFWNRLSTMDRVRVWNANVNASCGFCNATLETRDHLFFECSFSRTVWLYIIGNLMGPSPPVDWNQISAYIGSNQMNKVVKFLIKYSFQAVVYAIWIERNNRQHGQIPQDIEVLKKLIDKGIRNKISSMREHGIIWMKEGMQVWFSR